MAERERRGAESLKEHMSRGIEEPEASTLFAMTHQDEAISNEITERESSPVPSVCYATTCMHVSDRNASVNRYVLDRYVILYR